MGAYSINVHGYNDYYKQIFFFIAEHNCIDNNCLNYIPQSDSKREKFYPSLFALFRS